MTDEEIAAIRARLAAYTETQQRVGYVITSDYTTDVPMLLADNERLRMRETQLLAIIDGMDKGVVHLVSNRAVAPDGTEYPIIVEIARGQDLPDTPPSSVTDC